MLYQLNVSILLLLWALSISVVPIRARTRRLGLPIAQTSPETFVPAFQPNDDQVTEKPDVARPSRPSAAQLGGGWESLLNVLEEFLNGGNGKEYFGSRDLIQDNITAEFIKLAALEPGQNLLDLACGTGSITFPAKTIVGPLGHVVGVDDRVQMLKRAKRKAARQRKRISFLPFDITNLSGFNLPYLFDVITCASETALFTNQKEAVVKEWVRFLKPDGKIIVDVPTEDSNFIRQVLQQAAKDLGLTLALNNSWVTGPKAVKDLLESAGLNAEVFEPPIYDTIIYNGGGGLKIMDQLLKGPFAPRVTDNRLEPLAKELFLIEFRKRVNSEGVMVENVRSYIGVGKRKG